MWYIVNADTEQILDTVDGTLEPDANVAAETFHCPVYIIKGEHTGQCAGYDDAD